MITVPSIDEIRSIDPWYRDPPEQGDLTWTGAPRGETFRYEHPLPGDDDLTVARALPVTVVTGFEDGPTLLLIAGEHGNEYENIVALQETMVDLDPARVKGRVVAVHCCSVDSYLNSTRVGKADGQNLARCYPGKRDGTLTERIAHTLQSDFLGCSDTDLPVCLVAMHTYAPLMKGATLSGFNMYVDEPQLTDVARQACLATGLPLVWGHECDPQVPATAEMNDDDGGRTALYAAFLSGIPAIYWETIWGDGGEEEYKCALGRLLVHFGLDAGSNESIEPKAVIESHGHGAGNMASHNKTPVSGLWRPQIQVWDVVKEGDRLGEVRDLHGTALAAIEAQREGTVIGFPRMQYVQEGAQCGIVI